MHDVRKFFGWAFGIASIMSIWMAVDLILYGIRQRWLIVFHQHHTLRDISFLMLILLIQAIFPVLAVIWGVACWKIWRNKPTARGWGIAASVAYILFFLMGGLAGFHCWRSLPGAASIILAIGIAGLVVFLRRYETESGTGDSAPNNNPS
jgi:hypothetical protein